MEERKGMGLDGRVGRETLEEAGEGETVIRIYFMKKIFFNKRKIEKNKLNEFIIT